MKKNRTELVFILDRSGSMGGLETDTIGGFNAMLKKQQAVEGDCQVTTVLFDDEYELLHNQMDIHEVKPMTDKEYYVRGCTALYEYTGSQIKAVIEKMKTERNWQFVFLGANIDAADVAEEIGIDSVMAAEYAADEEGTGLNYEVLSDMAMDLRMSKGYTVGSAPLERIRRYKEKKEIER